MAVMPRLAVLLALLCALHGTCAVASRTVGEEGGAGEGPYPPVGWERLGIADASESVRLILAVKHRNEAAALNALDEISMPQLESERFRRQMSVEEIRDAFGPTEAVVERLVSFLEKEISATDVAITLGREFISCTVTVGDLEKALALPLHHFVHQRSHRTVVRASERSSLARLLPPSLVAHVDLVLGLQDFFDTEFERSGELSRLHPSLRPHREAAQASNSTYNAPWVMMATGGAQDVVVYFYALCQDGQTPANASEPCVERGLGIQSFSVDVTPDGQAPVRQSVTPEQAFCTALNGDIVCRATVELVKAYVRCEITTTTHYTDDSYSETYHYPTRYAPTEYIRPDIVFDLYNIPRNTRGRNAQNSQAIVSFERQYISFTDLQAFFDIMGIRQATPQVIGPNDPSVPGGESTLDVQWVMGVGQGINTTVWSFPEGDYILNWALAVADTTEAPLVTSISYGDTEIGYIQKSGYGLSYMERMNFELVKMGLRGLTVIAGSGDAGWTNVGEMGNDLSAPDETCTPGRAFYPSCSPYVMSLSATFVGLEAFHACGQPITPYPGAASIAVPATCDSVGEIAVGVTQGMSWTTGGGFSNVTKRHPYQDDAVQEFLSTSSSLPPQEYWNSMGQGYPDISTVGWNQIVVWDGVLFPIGGTSASGPVAAGIFALINDALLNEGKAPLGFINPVLYQWAASNPSSFRDVVSGNNNDGDIQPPGSSYPTYCEYGFDSQAGWDAVTGLGSPNFEQLVSLALAL